MSVPSSSSTTTSMAVAKQQQHPQQKAVWTRKVFYPPFLGLSSSPSSGIATNGGGGGGHDEMGAVFHVEQVKRTRSSSTNSTSNSLLILPEDLVVCSVKKEEGVVDVMDVKPPLPLMPPPPSSSASASCPSACARAFTKLHFLAAGAAPIGVLTEELRSCINVVDGRGRNPLHWVADCDVHKSEQHIISDIQVLTANGDLKWVQDDAGATPLLIAIRRGRALAAKYLLHPLAVTLTDNEGFSCLYEAVCACLDSVVEDLVHQYRVDVNAMYLHNDTVLHKAIRLGEAGVRILNILLACRSIDVNKVGNRGDVQFTGHSPLHLAAMFGNVVAMKKLITQGANLTAQDRFGQTPLHLAVKNEQFHAIRELINYGGYNIAMITDDLDHSPMSLAEALRNPTIIDYLRSIVRPPIPGHPISVLQPPTTPQSLKAPVPEETQMMAYQTAAMYHHYPMLTPQQQPTYTSEHRSPAYRVLFPPHSSGYFASAAASSAHAIFNYANDGMSSSSMESPCSTLTSMDPGSPAASHSPAPTTPYCPTPPAPCMSGGVWNNNVMLEQMYEVAKSSHGHFLNPGNGRGGDDGSAPR